MIGTWQRLGSAARSLPHKLLKNDSWEKLKDIFQEALERPPHLREQFLSEACGGDDEMRDEIRQLLASFDQDDEFMESPAIGEVAEAIVGKRDTLKKGQRVQRYQIIEKIGAGGMGEVFLALDTELERRVALKVLPQIFAGDETRVSRFIREAKAASALNHPNIITIYEILNFDGSYLIATEFIEGETLRSRQRRAPLTLPEVVDVAAQVSAALSAAHSAGIIHRDIKPENIMLRSDGLVKVLDFGLAKLAEKQNINAKTTAPARTAVTDPGIVMGTVSYMSPEQVRSVADIDSRADIWSLGVVIYETVSGKLPFAGGTTSDVIASILKSEPRPLPGHYPPELERIVEKTLQKERPQRYQTTGELILDLKSLGRELENSSWPDHVIYERENRSTGAVPYQITQNLRVQRFSLLHLLSVLAVVVTLLGGTWWFFARGRTNAPTEAQPLKNSEIVSWSSSTGEQVSAGTFSPDGKMIAFTSSKSGTRNIWIKQVASGEAIQITKDNSNNQNPVWSPDGSTIAFFSNRGDQYGIWQIPAFGGSPKLIAPVEDGGIRLHFWSSRNRIYFNSPKNVNLSALDTASGQTTQITNLPDALEMSISPSEELIASVVPEGEKHNIELLSLKDNTSSRVLQSPTEIRKVIWHPDNRRIFYSTPVDGVVQLFALDTKGGQPRQITFSDRDSTALDVAADGTRILYGSAKEESDIWGVDLADSSEFTVAPDIDAELWASAAPSGKRVAYQAVKNLSQGAHIYTASILTRDVNSNEPPVQLAQNAFSPAWSPNGEKIAFLQFESDEYQIMSVKAAGGEQKRLTAAGATPSGFTILPYNRVQKSDFSWSPDSTRIAYSSTQGGHSNIWLTNGDGSGETRITANGDPNLFIACPLWSTDNRRIAYSSRTQQRGSNKSYTYSFMLTDADKAEPKVVFQADYFARLIGWSPNEDSLIVASGGGDERITVPPEVTLFQISLETGERRPIGVMKDAYIFNIELSADRKQVAFVAHQDGKDNLWVMPVTGGKPRKITNNNDSRLYFSSLTWADDGSRIFYGKQMRYSILSMLSDFK